MGKRPGSQEFGLAQYSSSLSGKGAPWAWYSGVGGVQGWKLLIGVASIPFLAYSYHNFCLFILKFEMRLFFMEFCSVFMLDPVGIWELSVVCKVFLPYFFWSPGVGGRGIALLGCLGTCVHGLPTRNFTAGFIT